jgi:hypothetical protein
LEEFVDWFRGVCLKQAAKATSELMVGFKKEYVNKQAKKLADNTTVKKYLEGREKWFRCALAFRTFAENSRHQYAFLNIDCWANIFLQGRYCYIIPSFPLPNAKVKYPEWVEEYGYWNNSDPPTHLTTRQWATRRKHWDVAIDNFNHKRICFSVIEARNRVGLGHCMGDVEKMVLTKKEREKNVPPLAIAYWLLDIEETEKKKTNKKVRKKKVAKRVASRGHARK